MSVVIDTSTWVAVLKDRSGRAAQYLERVVGADVVFMVPPIRLELLQGCRGEAQWQTRMSRLMAFPTLRLFDDTWDGAARMYFDLRQAGRTVRRTLDCCIAQQCLEHDVLLIHSDRDYETIAMVRPLRQQLLDLSSPQI